MVKPHVYLAGPITGTPGSSIHDWRSVCQKALAPEIDVINPLRQRFEVVDESKELSCEERLRLMQHGRSIAARDRFDVARCDLLIVNFLGSTSVSIGSVGEIFWAD